MTDPFRPIPHKDALGRHMVLVEVPKPPKVSRRIQKRHEHTIRWGVFDRVIHRHEVDLDNPAHIHEHGTEEPDGAA